MQAGPAVAAKVFLFKRNYYICKGRILCPFVFYKNDQAVNGTQN